MIVVVSLLVYTLFLHASQRKLVKGNALKLWNSILTLASEANRSSVSPLAPLTHLAPRLVRLIIQSLKVEFESDVAMSVGAQLTNLLRLVTERQNTVELLKRVGLTRLLFDFCTTTIPQV